MMVRTVGRSGQNFDLFSKHPLCRSLSPRAKRAIFRDACVPIRNVNLGELTHALRWGNWRSPILNPWGSDFRDVLRLAVRDRFWGAQELSPNQFYILHFLWATARIFPISDFRPFQLTAGQGTLSQIARRVFLEPSELDADGGAYLRRKDQHLRFFDEIFQIPRNERFIFRFTAINPSSKLYSRLLLNDIGIMESASRDGLDYFFRPPAVVRAFYRAKYGNQAAEPTLQFGLSTLEEMIRVKRFGDRVIALPHPVLAVPRIIDELYNGSDWSGFIEHDYFHWDIESMTPPVIRRRFANYLFELFQRPFHPQVQVFLRDRGEIYRPPRDKRLHVLSEIVDFAWDSSLADFTLEIQSTLKPKEVNGYRGFLVQFFFDYGQHTDFYCERLGNPPVMELMMGKPRPMKDAQLYRHAFSLGRRYSCRKSA